ncbi:MAG: hypothetical protein IIA45_14450 [Bacteroidetes bacterium]|nr:hypothetical protein [Bacteroidota bacterium]
MPSKLLIHELNIRKNELLAELEAINTILKSNMTTDMVNQNGHDTKLTIIGTPKGKMGWEAYIKFTLKDVGGKSKVDKVVDSIMKANPTFDRKRVKSAVRHHLSKLYREGEIGAEHGSSKKEGYLYFLFETERETQPLE